MSPNDVGTLLRDISTSEISAYERDGATVLRNVVPLAWIERMRTAIDRILNASEPGPLAYEYTAEEAPGRYYGDFFLWRRDEDFRAFMAESPLPELASQILSSATVRFFYDQLLVKEPGTAEETPWHHDLPYWPLRGTQIVSVWVPFDRATKESGVVSYVAGSHRWGRLFAPAAFKADSGFADTYAKAGLEPLPDLSHVHEDHEVLCWELEPGDVLIHHPLTLHYAAGNSTAQVRRRSLALRYLGDDAVYDGRPGTFMENPRVRAALPDLALADGDPIDGPLFPRVWPRQAL